MDADRNEDIALKSPVVFEDEELADSFVELICTAHREVERSQRCYAIAQTEAGQQVVFEKVKSVVFNVFGAWFGSYPTERYVDLFDQVADFAAKLAGDHVFSDGNKRTALLMPSRF